MPGSRLKSSDTWRGELRALVAELAHERATADTERILVRTSGRVHVLDPNEIDWVEAAGDYVTIHAAGKSHLVRDSLRNVEARLATHGFRPNPPLHPREARLHPGARRERQR